MMLPPGFLTQWTLRICQAWRRQIILWKTQESLNRDNICSILKREEKNKLGFGVLDFCLQCDMWSDQNDDFKWKLQPGKVKVLLLEKKLELIEFWIIVEAMCSVQGCVLDLDQKNKARLILCHQTLFSRLRIGTKINEGDLCQTSEPERRTKPRINEKFKIKIKDKSCGGNQGLVTPQQPVKKKLAIWKLQILFLGACSWLDRISFSFHLGWQIYMITTDKTLQNV